MTRWKECCNNIALVCTAVLALAAIIAGYTSIRTDQVEMKVKVENIAERTARIEAKLDSMRDPYQGALK